MLTGKCRNICIQKIKSRRDSLGAQKKKQTICGQVYADDP